MECKLFMKVFTTTQIRQIDRLTIETEPIPSIDLMERASGELLSWFVSNISSTRKIYLFAGPGNNGGDGLALARMMIEVGYWVEVYILDAPSFSTDFQINSGRLIAQGVAKSHLIKGKNDFPTIDQDSIIVDALFGSGLSRPLAGIAAMLIDFINDSKSKIIAIDMPSGLLGEENPVPNNNPIIRASVTLTLQFPKFSFFFPENNQYVGDWLILPIGLSVKAIDETPSPYYYVDESYIFSILRERNKFYHKGNFGHCLIVSGSFGMMGAAVLSSTACIKSGAGLVTAHIPKAGYEILQQSMPEVIVNCDENDSSFSGVSSLAKYSSVGIGPGIGRSHLAVKGMSKILKEIDSPLVIDADGLNILSENRDLMNLIPFMTIITPHPGEFDRMFGKSDSGYNRLQVAINESARRNIIIVLKGAYTQVICPNGKVFFNSTGNPGMATAGSGDVLTGIITSLLGQGYDPIASAILGVYIHGLAGDLASQAKSQESLSASDIINYIGDAYKLILSKKDE